MSGLSCPKPLLLGVLTCMGFSIGGLDVSEVPSASGSSVPMVPSIKGNEVFIPPVNDSEVSADSKSFALEREVVPAWHLGPYSQPLCQEEQMAESSSLSRCMKVDRIVYYLAYSVSMLGALDAAELSQDEELESTRLKLRNLEDELNTKKREVFELQTISQGCCFQAKVFQARVATLEIEVSFKEATIAELLKTNEALEMEKIEIESASSRTKDEMLQCLKEQRVSSFKKEKVLSVELMEACSGA